MNLNDAVMFGTSGGIERAVSGALSGWADMFKLGHGITRLTESVRRRSA
jgi:hypothetical protein